jgi:hypothetical protein
MILGNKRIGYGYSNHKPLFPWMKNLGNVECAPGKGGFMRRLAGLSCHGMYNYDLDFF